jgi:hypothetical protein
VNTTSLTASRSGSDQAAVVRDGARRVRERASVRLGLALVAWGRRADARRTREALALRRSNELAADRLREGNFASVALRTGPSF